MTGTHYDRLGVDPASTLEEIRLAYLRAARLHHPDRHPGSGPEAARPRQEAMVAINAAWFVLRDPDRRRLYDQDLERADRERRLAAEQQAWEAAEAAGPAMPDGPAEFGSHGNPATSIARLYAVVWAAVLVLLAIAFAYAVIKSGSVGLEQ